MTHMDAYAQGITHALTAAAWAAGALTVALALALVLLAALWAAQPLCRAVHRRLTSHRLHREARRSGRWAPAFRPEDVDAAIIPGKGLDLAAMLRRR